MHAEFEEAWTDGEDARTDGPVALLCSRFGGHAENSGRSCRPQRTGTWRCTPVNSRGT